MALHSCKKWRAWKHQAFRSEDTFLSLWSTASRILPFKVRPHSVSPYPHASSIPVAHRLLQSLLLYLVTSQSCDHVSRKCPSRFFLYTPRKKQQPTAIHFTLCVEIYTSGSRSWIMVRWESESTLSMGRAREGELWMSVDDLLILPWPQSCSQGLHCALTWSTVGHVCEIHLTSIWHCGE